MTLNLLQQFAGEVLVVVVDAQAFGLRQGQAVPRAEVGVAVGDGRLPWGDEAPLFGGSEEVEVVDCRG